MKIKSRVGEQRLNNQGLMMTIIEYTNSTNLIVSFENGYTTQCTYTSFMNGQVKNRYIPTVCGVGIIGDMKSRENGEKTKEYKLWQAMIKRCYSKTGKTFYEDVSVCDEWLFYPNFFKWLTNQENYMKWKNDNSFNLDKDILGKDNRVYSPTTCLLVPQEINNIYKSSRKRRGKYPLGVSAKKKSGKEYIRYEVCRGNQSKIEGFSETVEEAFEKYKFYKEQYVKELASKHYKEGNITRQCYEAMMQIEVNITD